MSRIFSLTDQRAFQAASAPVSAVPFSIGAFYRYNAASETGDSYSAVSLSDLDDPTGAGHRLMVYGATSGSGLGMSARTSAGGTDKEAYVALTFGDIALTTWIWMLGVWESNSARHAYCVNLAAIATASETTSITPVIQALDIGQFFGGGVAAEWLDGDLSHVTIWDHAFSATEVDSFWLHGTKSQRGYIDPRTVRPQNIQFCWLANRKSSTSANDADQWTGNVLTNVNSPRNSDVPYIQRAAGY